MNIAGVPNLQIKQDSTITFYIDIEYTFFTLFFQEKFSFQWSRLGDHNGNKVTMIILMLSLPFKTGDVFMLDF